MRKDYRISGLGKFIELVFFNTKDLSTEIIFYSSYMKIINAGLLYRIEYSEINNIDLDKDYDIEIQCLNNEFIWLKYINKCELDIVIFDIQKYLDIYNKRIQQEKEEKERLKVEQLKVEEEKKLELEAERLAIEQRKEEERQKKTIQTFKKYENNLNELHEIIHKYFYEMGYLSGSKIEDFNVLFKQKFEQINFLKKYYDKDILDNETIAKFDEVLFVLNDFDKFIRNSRNKFLKKELKDEEKFFKRISKPGLKLQQKIACIVNNDNNLVIAGAGSGKTLVMLARAAYLIQKEIVDSSKILILAYNKKAQEELKNRAKKIPETKVYYPKYSKNIATFHSLGKTILQTVDKIKYDVISPQNQKSIIKKCLINLMSDDESFFDKILKYFKFYVYPYPDIKKYNFKSLGEYAQFMKLRSIKAINPNDNPFGTYDECIIANFLYFNDITYEVNKFVEQCENLKASFYLGDLDIYIFYQKNSFSNKYDTQNNIFKYDCLKNIKYFIISYNDCLNPHSIEKKLSEELESFNIKLASLDAKEIIKKIEQSTVINELIQLLSQFLSLYKNSQTGKLNEIKKEVASQNTMSHKRTSFFIEIFEYIYYVYEEELKKNNLIDFDDMIFKANKYVKEGRYISPYDYIMIDEFQDISYARAELIKNLLLMSKKPNLFCVGDDWQAIYRFSGSELRFVTNFGHEFADGNQLYFTKTLLDYTFRFNDKILTTSSSFIMKNENQEEKDINVISSAKRPKVNIVLKSSIVVENILFKILNKIKKRKNTTQDTEILILSRYNNYKGIKETKKDIEEYFEDTVSKEFGMIIRYASIHSSKGQEADYVILIDVKSGFRSFPSTRDSDEIIEMMLPKKETNIDFAEERRLMYVALTRAKKEVWVESDYGELSPFIKELMEKKDYFKVRILDLTDFEDKYNILKNNIECPICDKGTIVEKTNKEGGVFYGCNNFPGCTYTLKYCLQCNASSAVIRESQNRYYCFNCENRFKVCSECNDGIRTLKEYKNYDGINKQIYCSNYKLLGCKPQDKNIKFHSETDIILPNLEANKKIRLAK